MIKLTYERPESHAPYSAVNSFEMTIDNERSLSEMLEAYKEFLLALGFSVDGDLEVINETTNH